MIIYAKPIVVNLRSVCAGYTCQAPFGVPPPKFLMLTFAPEMVGNSGAVGVLPLAGCSVGARQSSLIKPEPERARCALLRFWCGS